MRDETTRFDTDCGAVVIVHRRLDLATCDRHHAPDIYLRCVPARLTPAEARELAGALAAAIAKAETWASEAAAESGEGER